MKVLLDHNIPRQVGNRLQATEIVSARRLRWDAIRNGDLLKAAEEAHFDVMLTADQSIFYQQNNQLRKIALVVVSTNDRAALARDITRIQDAIQRAAPGSFEAVQVRQARAVK